MTDQPKDVRKYAIWRVFLPPPGWQAGSWLPYDKGLCMLMTATDAAFQTTTHILPEEGNPAATEARVGSALLAFRILSQTFDAYGITQFAQLLGYSLAGFHELSYVADEDARAATAEARRLGLTDVEGCRDIGCEIHCGVEREQP